MRQRGQQWYRHMCVPEEWMAVAVCKEIHCHCRWGFAPNEKRRGQEEQEWKRDGAGWSCFPKHLISAVVFYFSGVLEWKFAFNPSLTS